MSQTRVLPRFDTMYAALLERDPAFDGVFVVCVRTTGVFCRPTCHARKPLRENVEFVATPEAAQRAGYGPCRLCRPLEPPGSHPAWACDLISTVRADGERLTDERLRARGLNPSRVRSYFRRRFGVTFHAFQRARRMGEALRRLRVGHDTLRAGFDSGYESSSGFRHAFAAEFGIPPGRARGAPCLVAGEIETPLRPMLAVSSGRGICLLEFLDRRALAAELRALSARLGIPIVPGSNEHLERLRTELDAYFRGALRRFEVSLDLSGTPFQRRVWSRLLEIPFGDTVSYSRIAEEVGRREAVRAVGHANGRNPVAIVVPCHRVVRTDGSLCGYGGGLWRKRWLLQHEREGEPAKLSTARRPDA
jgi:AraC family transcriptional regulator of adaptative response/methylated-DNA-[protein]-cysteine methyltransferase